MGERNSCQLLTLGKILKEFKVALITYLDFSLYCTESHGSKMCTQQVGFLTKVIIILHGVKGNESRNVKKDNMADAVVA